MWTDQSEESRKGISSQPGERDHDLQRVFANENRPHHCPDTGADTVVDVVRTGVAVHEDLYRNVYVKVPSLRALPVASA